MTHAPVGDGPQPGDLVVYRERGVHSGPCRVGAVGNATLESLPTFAQALRRANTLAVEQRVDVWVGFRARWTDTGDRTFDRVASHRVAEAV